MILLDLPYVSDFLIQTIKRNRFPVFEPSGPKHFDPGKESFCLDEFQAIRLIREHPDQCIYTNSENSINWIARHLEFTGLPVTINQFKDKVAFRQLTNSLFPEVFFRELDFDDIRNLSVQDFPIPFVIKPSVGFFSLGVYTINSYPEWEPVKERILAEVIHIKELYPSEVLNTSKFLVEQYIEGVEYAFDAYFDGEGRPVILNILKHLFASGEDVSDRVYVTSKAIFLENQGRLLHFLEQVGQLVPMKNFPLHVEVRIDSKGKLIPIEVNPLRFGGWCTTADLTWYAYGVNSYEYFLTGRQPNWKQILEIKDETFYSLVVLNNSTGIPGKEIRRFDFERLLTHFKKPLELRKTEHTLFPLFGFLFLETRVEDPSEIDWILKNDLKEFIR